MRREAELRDTFWAYMLEKGSHIGRFHDTRDSAVALVSQLLRMSPVILDIQRELLTEGKGLKNTTAGSCIHRYLEAEKETSQRNLGSLERMKGDFLKRDNFEGSRVVQRIEADLETEVKRLAQAKAQQDNLGRCHIAEEVDSELGKQAGKRKFQTAFPFVLSFISFVVNVLLALLGISPLAATI